VRGDRDAVATRALARPLLQSNRPVAALSNSGATDRGRGVLQSQSMRSSHAGAPLERLRANFLTGNRERNINNALPGLRRIGREAACGNSSQQVSGHRSLERRMTGKFRNAAPIVAGGVSAFASATLGRPPNHRVRNLGDRSQTHKEARGIRVGADMRAAFDATITEAVEVR